MCHLNPAPSAGLWDWQNELKEKRGTRGCREHCGVGAPAGPWGLGTGHPGQLGEERNGPEGLEGKRWQQRKGHQSLPWPVTAAPTRTQSRVVPARSYRHKGPPPAPSSTAVLGGCRSPGPGWDSAAAMVTHSSKPQTHGDPCLRCQSQPTQPGSLKPCGRTGGAGAAARLRGHPAPGSTPDTE